MNAQMVENLFVESYLMMNLEITFSGVRAWFEMADVHMDDATLFRNLLFPEHIASEKQAEMARIVVYRYEDVFFQIHRVDDSEEEIHPLCDVEEPVHQLLLRMMHTRQMQGIDNAIIDLGVILQKDKVSEDPIFASLHGVF
ncbi:hypothetical protein GZH47_31685 (plasmid) [Paenibacillus rhizovicinus]|uniref:Uncharacterized protein n=1 Tax=Paenibacillus rhizovicinus TaxID=2704463 RepID=A0A6C0PAQ8_9BACL|nr:hypothetical protein [Paenibacillus rhizovicinus]QHW35461.1 hypothetical protein GZH47_31685 [Paenibacillus rhizovicinus]